LVNLETGTHQDASLILLQGYLDSNRITQGSSKRCREAQASTAFLWFGFAAFLVSTVVSGIATRGGANTRPGIRRGPAMSQV
jgi:hypothetical protein